MTWKGPLYASTSALTCAPSGETLGALRGVALAAHFWRDEWAQAMAAGPEALRLLPPGSAAWCRAAAIMLPISMLVGNVTLYGEIASTLGRSPTDESCRAICKPRPT